MTRRRRKPSKNEPFITLVILALIAGLTFVRQGFTNDVNLLVVGLASVLTVSLILLAAYAYQQHRKRAALRALTLSNVRTMSGVDFEHYVGALLQHQGYLVTYTVTSGDYGVDIVAKRNGVSTAVQVKRYKSMINQDAVRQAVAGMAHYKCAASMVVTNSFFTPAAKTLATSNHCTLVDGEKLGEWMIAFRKK